MSSEYKIQEWRSVHELKCFDTYFRAVAAGEMPFQVRKNDRNFQSGDILWLREWELEEGRYTGRSLYCTITLILSKFAPDGGVDVIAPGYVVMGLGKRSSIIDVEPFTTTMLPSLTLAFALDIDASEIATTPRIPKAP